MQELATYFLQGLHDAFYSGGWGPLQDVPNISHISHDCLEHLTELCVVALLHRENIPMASRVVDIHGYLGGTSRYSGEHDG
jgi:hypothetical protein